MPLIFDAAAAMLAATAPQQAHTAPFTTAAVSDVELAAAAGTGGPRWRLTDEVAAATQRQTAAITATIKDLWLIDVASPLIAANVRAAGIP